MAEKVQKGNESSLQGAEEPPKESGETIDSMSEAKVKKPYQPGPYVSKSGGFILIIALLILIVSWGLLDNLQDNPPSDSSPSVLAKYHDDVEFVGNLWNFGILVAVFGAIVIAFSEVRKG